MKSKLLRGALGATAATLLHGLAQAAPPAAAILPATLPVDGPAQPPSRPWTVDDVVEFREITDLARSGAGGQVAFVVKQPSIEAGGIAFGLYVMDAKPGSVPRKLLEAPYLARLAWHPGTDHWSVLADFGEAIQLYDVDAKGGHQALVVNADPLPVGGHIGYIHGAANEVRPAGVLDYEWSPDGKALWYSKARVQSPAERAADADRGLAYDDRRMNSFAMAMPDQRLQGMELHTFAPGSGNDVAVAYAPSIGLGDMMVFTAVLTHWMADSRHIRYVLELIQPNDETENRLMIADAASGQSERVEVKGSPWDSLLSVAVGSDGDYLMVRQQDAGNRLLRMARDGHVVKDFGVVPYRGFAYDSTSWTGAAGDKMILGVRYRDHEGLAFLPAQPGTAAVEQSHDHLSHCQYPDGGAGEIFCVRETISQAPELVAIATATGAVRVLARPNAERYDAIEPLRSEPQKWTNKYGGISVGYITYPRGYVEGRKYPVIVVTHSSDAQNRFAYYGFQWEFPVQVYAERGYIVLSVNDPWLTDKTRAASDAFNGGKSGVDVEKVQFEEAFNAVASMESAVQSVIDRGIADPARVGICGYSRGAEVVDWTMSQSKMFKAASDGDAGGWQASGYWNFGTRQYVGLYNALYGGSPWDPKALPWYRRLAPSVRAAEFSGPLLQQFSAIAALVSLELHTTLTDAGIPTELDYFPGEAHIFWQPRHRQAAMQRNLDWFDYWLLDRRDPAADKQAQYQRWDAMAKTWRSRRVP